MWHGCCTCICSDFCLNWINISVFLLIPKTYILFTYYCRSKNFNDFISKCLIKDPKQRPTAVELLEVIFLLTVKTSVIALLLPLRCGTDVGHCICCTVLQYFVLHIHSPVMIDCTWVFLPSLIWWICWYFTLHVDIRSFFLSSE